jgi:N-formylglutamate deformylase
VNRPPDGESLSPGQATTGLCPMTDFDGNPLWRPGAEPDAAEVARRRTVWWSPYHAALRAEIDRVRQRHGYALLYDAHSIRSVVPRLFEGTLPDFNIGTNGGTSCDPAIEERILRICAAAPGYSHVLNGRFKGGYITRQYGRPAEGVHAVQMELAQWRYMSEEAPFAWRDAGAASLGAVLRRVIEAMLDWEPNGLRRD